MTITTKQYFTEAEMHERIVDILGYYDGDDILDETVIFMELANTDYYITYTKEAKEALEQFGVFKALEIVTDYEVEMHGQATRRVAEPASFANFLWYILCEKYVYETLELSQYETVGEAYEALF